jgi:hypothetical protein
MNLSVIQTQNLENDLAGLGCYISLNQELLDIITPLSSNTSENFTQISASGNLEFVIKDMRKDRVLGLLNVDTDNLPREGLHWFRLDSDLNPCPSILISFNNSASETQKHENSPSKKELGTKINELQTLIMDLECKLAQEKDEKNREIQNKNKLLQNIQTASESAIDQLKIKVSGSMSIIEELNLQKANLIHLYHQETQKSKLLQQKVFEIQNSYNETLEIIRKKEFGLVGENFKLQQELQKTKESLNNELLVKDVKDSLISQLSYKLNLNKISSTFDSDMHKRLEVLIKHTQDLEVQKLSLQKLLETAQNPNSVSIQCQNCELKDKEAVSLNQELIRLRNIEIEAKANEGLLVDIKERNLFQENEIKDLLVEIDTKKNQINQLTQDLNGKTIEFNNSCSEVNEISAVCAGLKQTILALTRNEEILENEIMDLKCKSINARKIEKIRLDEIDSSLEEYLSSQCIENLFVKLAHGVYLYGTKKINITLKNDKTLICRIGGGYIPIDQFLKLYQNTEIEEISKYIKKQSLFLSQGSSPVIHLSKRNSSTTPDNISHRSSPKENSTERKFEKKLIDKLKVLYPLTERNYTPTSRKAEVKML